MPSLELDIDQLREIKEVLEFRVAAYRRQARDTGCTKDGLDWIERYAKKVEEINKKIAKAMRVDISIKFNSDYNRYDWAYGMTGYPEWRVGLKDLEDTKKWLKNEKLMNPYIVFTVMDA